MPLDMGTMTGAVSNVGFPIAAFLLMYRLVRETIKENTEALRELQEVVADE